MEPNKESVICVKSAAFKPENVQLEARFRVDFGKPLCSERMEMLRGLGVDPANNTLVFVHEFPSEDGAKKAAAKIQELKETDSPVALIAPYLTVLKAEGNKLIMAAAAPPPMIQMPAQILTQAAMSMGDLVDKPQHFELKLSASKTIKDILTKTEAQSPVANFLEQFCFKATLAIQKDLPIKIGDFIATMAPPHHQSEPKMAGRIVSCFHHLNLDIELREPVEEIKKLFKDEAMMMLPQMAGMGYGMGMQLGVIDVAKMGGQKTTVYLCLTPMLRFEFEIFAPTVIDALETIATMGGGM